MSIEQSKEALLEQLEALKKENEQLRKELSTLRDEKYNDRPVSFKEKYAVRILDSLPDMLTVFNQSEVGIEVVSNEETNHVGISNKDFRGMRMQDMVPPEAYQNIHSNMRHAIQGRRIKNYFPVKVVTNIFHPIRLLVFSDSCFLLLFFHSLVW